MTTTQPSTHASAVLDAAVTAKAAVLGEALPWLEKFAGATVVVKYGGSAMSSTALQESFAADIVFLRRVGLRPVVVHGGGPQISTMLDRLGVGSEFVDGLRVTTPEAMDVVRMVLTGQVQRDIVGLINRHGPLAVGMSGEDAHLFTARRLAALTEDGEVDLGQVGRLTDVDPSFVCTVLEDGLIPVVSSIARGSDGGTYNVNADSAAASLASALGARKLVMLTDVPGVYAAWPDTSRVISELTATQLREFLPTAASGMIPKLGACLDAVTGGVSEAHILDGRVDHALLLEIFTDEGVGTLVVADTEAS
ncbi:MAG: acetylglutamate kinase [Actinomycetes bacterium]